MKFCRAACVILLSSASLCAIASGVGSDGLFVPGRMVLGANYWASHAATEMWRKWDAKAVDEDLRILAGNGIRILRVFPNWADFQPIHACYLSGDNWNEVYETRMFDSEEPLSDTPCGRAGVDERMVERFEEFCDIAEKHGIRLIVPLLTGQMTFRNYIPPALANRNPYSDPYALMWEARYLECMVSRLKTKKAIVAWQSGNEARILGDSKNAAMSEAWLRYVHQTIRLADPSRPVIGIDGLSVSRETKWPSEMNGRLSDYVTVHPYGFWDKVYNDDFNSVRSLSFAAVQAYALEHIAGKPAFVEEHGSRRQEQTSRQGVAHYMRAMLWNLWAVDAKAMLWWCAYDQTAMAIAPYNWRQPCVELGLFRRDRSPYPVVESVAGFAAFQDSLPFKGLAKAKTDAVVISADSEVIHSSYILARQAGIMPRFANPEAKLPVSGCYFLPDAKGRAYLTIERWEELKSKVRDGATLYLSWNDTFLDSIEEVAGVEVAFREKRAGVDLCDFGDFKVEVPYQVKRRFNALTAETLAKNRDGEGVFFRNAYGKGKVYLFVHNFERTFFDCTGRYESDGCRIWEKVLPVSRIVRTDKRNIFVSEHPFGDGRVGVILVNNSRTGFEGKVRLCEGWSVSGSYTDNPQGAKFAGKDGLFLSGNSGILLVAEKK